MRDAEGAADREGARRARPRALLKASRQRVHVPIRRSNGSAQAVRAAQALDATADATATRERRQRRRAARQETPRPPRACANTQKKVLRSQRASGVGAHCGSCRGQRTARGRGLRGPARFGAVPPTKGRRGDATIGRAGHGTTVERGVERSRRGVEGVCRLLLLREAVGKVRGVRGGDD